MNQDLNNMLRKISAAINDYLQVVALAQVVQHRPRKRNNNYEFTTADLPKIDRNIVRFDNNAVNVRASSYEFLGRRASKTEMYRMQQLLKESGYPLRGELKRKHTI